MSGKLAPLTSLRFIAAMMIVMHHGHAEFKTLGTALVGVPLSGGVSFFFVLSGFILAYAHPQVPSLAAAADFWVKRFARIWPVHLATLMVLLLFIGSNSSGGTFETSGALASNVLLLQAWFNDFRYVFSFNAVSWSISVEAFFYAVFPLLIYRIEQTWPIKLVLCTFIVALLCLFYQDQFAMGLIPESRFPSWVIIQFNPLARLLEFMVGMTAFVLWRKYLQEISISRSVWTVIEVTVIAAAILSWKQSQYLPVHLLGDFARGWWFLAGIFIVPATLIIILMATSRGVVSSILSQRPFIFLGEISFSLYMIHQLVLRWYQVNRPVFDGYSNDAVLIWYVGASIIAAIGLWAVVETPCRHAILSAYRKAGAVKAAATTQLASTS